jgi:predicted PurR-regulated permease PerM
MPSPAPVPPVSPPWSDRAKRTAALIALVVVGWFVLQVTETLPIIVIASVLAFLFTPLTNVLERALGGRRALAILFTFVIILLLLALVVLVIVPTLFDQLRDFFSTLPERLGTLRVQLEAQLGQPVIIAGQPLILDGRPLIPLEQLQDVFGTGAEADPFAGVDLVGIVQGAVGSLSGGLFRFLGGAFNTVLNLFLLLVIIFYLIKDGARFVGNVVAVTPPSHRSDAARLFAELRAVWNAYLRGQLILSLFIGTLVFFTALVLGVPNPLVLGLLSGVLEFIPTLGPLLALIPAALLALVSQSETLPFLSGVPFALVVVVVWTVIQNIEALVVVPRVMGDSLDLHPVVVMIGVLLGASLAGALGVILAAPMIASVRVLGQYLYGKLTDTPPFVERAKAPPAPPLGDSVRAWWRRMTRSGRLDRVPSGSSDSAPSKSRGRARRSGTPAGKS